MPVDVKNAQQYLPLVIVGLLVALVVVIYVLVNKDRRLWLARQYHSGHSVLLLIAAFLVILLGLGLIQLQLDKQNRISQLCLIQSPSPGFSEWLRKLRGCNYGLDADLLRQDPDAYRDRQECLYDCVATGWSGLHFLTYFALGFLAPDLWLLSVGVGVGFEWVESRIQCHDWLDVLYNTLGVIAGAKVRGWMDPPRRPSVTDSTPSGSLSDSTPDGAGENVA